MRCMPRATLRGLSTWITRSIAPMSMPSSRLLVATRAGQPPGLQLLLDQAALLAGQAAVVGAGDLLLGQLVEPQRQALGQPPVVDEDERGAVGPDQLQQLGVHRRPDGAAAALAAGHLDGIVLLARGAGPARACPPPGTTTLRSSSFALPASTIDTGRGRPSSSWPPRKRAISASGRWVADRPMRWRLPARRDHQAVEALQAQGQVRAALGAGHGVDLVDDHRPDVGEDLLARAR